MPNRGLDEINVSDGTGEAVLANIESDRGISATTINVDSVENWPQKFIFATGDKDANNFIDPSSMTIMYGHLDTGDIIIDGYAPGYADAGNTDGQIAVIKPNSYAIDELVALLQVSLENDGSMKGINYDETTGEIEVEKTKPPLVLTDAYTINSTDWDGETVRICVSGGFLWIRVAVDAKTTITDTGSLILTVDMAALGLTSAYGAYVAGYTDGGNTMTQIDFNGVNGELTLVGSEPLDVTNNDRMALTVVTPVAEWATS